MHPLNNVNLLNAASLRNGSGTGAMLTTVEFHNAIRNAVLAKPSRGAMLNDFLPEALGRMQAVYPGANFITATLPQLAVALPAMVVFTPEISNTFYDNQGLISIGDEPSRLRAQDIFTHALNTIRAEQANVANQKTNITEVTDALRASINAIQKSADSYLKTDYVLTAQQYSETIRIMVASITSLQAANKIPEAAQKLIDALAR